MMSKLSAMVCAARVGALLFASGCTQLPTAPPPTSKINTPSDAIEAFFREMFREHEAVSRMAKLRCLSIGSYPTSPDPSPDFMARFSKDVPPVGAASQCGFDIGAFEKRTKAPAIIFIADDLGCSTPQTCKVAGGYLIGNVGSSSATYIVEKRQGRWSVRIDESQPRVMS